MLIKRYTFKKSHPRQRLGTNPKQLDPLLIKPSALTLRNCNRDHDDGIHIRELIQTIP